MLRSHATPREPLPPTPPDDGADPARIHRSSGRGGSTDGLRGRPQLRLRAEVEPDKLPSASPKEVGVGRWGGPHPGGPRTHAV